MKVKSEFKEENKLECEKDDLITIIEGNAGKYWWKGQNKRTCEIGSFPRAILDPQRRITGEDISLPLKNSFIHTGHMSVGQNEKTWGNPGKIDEIFLSNPLNPPDLLGDLATAATMKTEPTDGIANTLDTSSSSCEIHDCNSYYNSTNLIDLLDTTSNYSSSLNEANVRVTYPDYSASLDSYESPSYDTQSSQSSSMPQNNNNNLSMLSTAFSNAQIEDNSSPSLPTNIANYYMNDNNSNYYQSNQDYYNVNSSYTKGMQDNLFPVNNKTFSCSSSLSPSNSVVYKQTNPFFDSQQLACSKLPSKFNDSKKSKVNADELLNNMISMNISLL
jgi:activated CDC42 kinase 1